MPIYHWVYSSFTSFYAILGCFTVKTGTLVLNPVLNTVKNRDFGKTSKNIKKQQKSIKNSQCDTFEDSGSIHSGRLLGQVVKIAFSEVVFALILLFFSVSFWPKPWKNPSVFLTVF